MNRGNGRDSPTANKCILIVDDDAGMLTLTGIMLERAGFVVKKAVSGPEALEVAESHPPDLFVLDVMMPDMDGVELCEHIRSRPRLSHAPVIFLSAQTDARVIQDGLKAGAAGYLIKPINNGALVSKVRTLLGLE